jgi:integrase
MEAFGEPVVSGKPPHPGDLLFPVLKGLWRRLCPEQGSRMPETFPGRWKALRAAAGVPALHDGLRHTFASMHYAEHQNAAHLQAVMGHDETQGTLFAHYRAVKTTGGEWITKKMAREFWV